MKKIISICIFTAITLALFYSCSKKDEDTPRQKIEVKFDYTIGTSAAMPSTKAGMCDEDIMTALKKNIPSAMDITLTSSDGKEIIPLTTGEFTSVYTGKYHVTGTYRGSSYKYCDNDSLITVSNSPFLKIDQYIDLQISNQTYTLNAQYDCFAIATDETEASGLVHVGNTLANVSSRSVKINDSRVYFIQMLLNDAMANSVKIDMSQTSDPDITKYYLKTEYHLSKNAESENNYKVKDGYCYKLHMTPYVDESSTTKQDTTINNQAVIEFSLPTWNITDVPVATN